MKELKIKSIRTHIVTHFIINKPQTRKRRRFLKEYPAHLHINILPGYQRQGIGHRLMKSFESNLKEKEVFGFHLEVSKNNKLGISFYEKYGLDLARKNRFNWVYTTKLEN
jgi:ribosomal protein S18 acetylase RimI-like enzyme